MASSQSRRSRSTLAGAGERRLVWRDGVFLRHRLPLLDGQGPLGTVLAEQPLPELTATLEATDAPWRSAEFLLCRPHGQAPMRCFPSRHNPVPFTMVPGAVGVPPRARLSSARRARGLRAHRVDYRGHPVLGAYDRVGRSRAGGRPQGRPAEIHGPTGRRFGRAIGLGVLLTSIGAGLVWRRVRPLAAALEARVWERTTELWQANAQLAESEQRLRRLNAELERRVREHTAELRRGQPGARGLLLFGLPRPARARCATSTASRGCSRSTSSPASMDRAGAT